MTTHHVSPALAAAVQQQHNNDKKNEKKINNTHTDHSSSCIGSRCIGFW